MPCGGIHPIAGSWIERSAGSNLRCIHCDKPGCTLWCIEWDSPLHLMCVEEFLKTPDGMIVIQHGHSIVLTVDGPEVFWNEVEGHLCDAHGDALFLVDPRDGDPDTPIPYVPTSHKLN